MYLGANCTALTDFLLSNSCVFFSQRPPGPSPSPIPPADKISFIQTTEGWRANKYRKNIENTIPYFITLYHCDTGHGYRISPCSSQIITLLSSLQDANIYTNHKNNKINSTRESQVTVSIQHALHRTAHTAADRHCLCRSTSTCSWSGCAPGQTRGAPTTGARWNPCAAWRSRCRPSDSCSLAGRGRRSPASTAAQLAPPAGPTP